MRHRRVKVQQENLQEDIRELLADAEAIRNNPVSYFFFRQEREPLLNRVLLPENTN